MRRNLLKIISVLLISGSLISCGNDKESITKAQADINYDVLLRGGERDISFVNEARPVLEKRCIVCHGCYDAPCQLKLTSIEGIRRGANPKKVYDAERIFAAEPTRMFIDANSEEEWRKKGFHSVLNEQEDNEINNLRHSVLYKMLRLKQLNPQPRVGMIDDSVDLSLGRKQTCPVNDDFEDYAEDFPFQGMPFATPNLTDDEYHVLVKWISQGMPDDSKKSLPDSTVYQIKKWEAFLNKTDLKHKLVSRYIYEHLFLGHLYFKGANNREFFRLVRSYTPPGSEISEIPTLRVFDSPGVEKFYYRLRYIKSSIVDKSHVVYELSDKRIQRYKKLFIEPEYTVKSLPSYDLESASNPMRTFVDIPVKSRYRFLLDDSKFFIEGFIKGPVCRGQVALNVIEDHFWVFFTSPDKFWLNHDDKFVSSMVNKFQLPAEQGNTLNLISTWTNYWDLQSDYMLGRQERYINMPKMDLDEAMKMIWDGNDGWNKNNNALSIFRHFDSATVKQGLIGDYPEMAWILDYPVLERIHYLLVAGYDVYGNVGHQFNTRIYMDFLRMEAENIFLAFLPVETRLKVREGWYKGIRKGLEKYFKEPDKWLNVNVIEGFKSDDPLREFFQVLEKRVGDTSDEIDRMTRCMNPGTDKDEDKALSKTCSSTIKMSNVGKEVQRILEMNGEHLRVFPDVSFIKVTGKQKEQVYTLILNKGYKNISTLLSDTDSRDLESDTLTIYKGVLGAYPNFFFVVDELEIEHFVDKVMAIRNRDDYERFVAIYGVRRTGSTFWQEADWFNEQYKKQNPIEYGIFDLYRYKNR